MDTYNIERIEKLRQEALAGFGTYDEFRLLFFRKYFGLDKGSKEERYAQAFKYACENASVNIFDGELIVGRVPKSISPEEQEEYELLKERSLSEFTVYLGQDSHMTVDYEDMLSSGLEGIIKRIEDKLCNETDEEKICFYRGAVGCLEGVIAYSQRYAECALKMAVECGDEVRRGELERLAEACKNAPRKPASGFYEAVQAVHFITHCLSFDPSRPNYQQFQLGRPDRYLYPYYKQDLEKGIITKDFAQELMDCLGIQINNRVPNGLSSGYMVGGRNADGSLVANDLTEIGMQVVDDIRLVYPSVGLCVTKDYPGEYIKKACTILSHGRSHPAIFNDEVITEGMKYYGVPAQEACEYIHSTCVEITPIASSNVWVASPYTNLTGLLLKTMKRECSSFEELLDNYFEDLFESIRINFESENENRKKRAGVNINPLLSCFVRDCIENGKDIEKGGARYNWIMPSFVGMANLIDSLYAINRLVFVEKEITMSEYIKALDSNFEGYEELLLKIQNKIPKYGNDNDEIDSYAGMITEKIVEECKKYTLYFDNGKLIPSVFCWIMHSVFGSETGATPDGRRAGFPMGDGSGPCQGREMKGPTASIISSTKWSHKEFIGGVAVNMKFSKRLFSEDSIEKMLAIVKTFIERGGFEIQINVVDKETLLRARETPEAYRDLVVRIGGYSDYFTTLSPGMQEEVILRTEHEI